jgi:hypothetical protein
MKVDSRIDNLFDIQVNRKLDEKTQKKEIEKIKNMQKKMFYSPYGDYITMLNVYTSLKNYMKSSNNNNQQKNPKLWCRENGISSRTFINKSYSKGNKGWDFIGDSARKIKYILMGIVKPNKNKVDIEIESGENFLEQDIMIPKLNNVNNNNNNNNNNIKNIIIGGSNDNKNNKNKITLFPNAKKYIRDLRDKIYVGKELNHILYKKRKKLELTESEKNLIKKPDEEFRNMKVLMALTIGNICNLAKIINKKEGKYKTCFPIQKVYAKMDRNSTLLKNPDIVLYNELFTTSKEQKTMKLNIVTEVPKDIIKIIKDDYGNLIKSCFEKENNKKDYHIYKKVEKSRKKIKK